MDQEGDGVLLPFLIADRLDDVAVHRLVVPAGEAELLVFAEGLGVEGRVGLGQATRHFTTQIGLEIQIAGRLQAVLGENEARRRLLEGRDVAGAGDRGDDAVARVHGEQPGRTHVAGGRVQGLAVARPLQGVRRTVPVRRDLALLTALNIHQHDLITVGLKARTRHRAIGQGAAVRRKHRPRVPGRIVLGQVGEGPVAGQAVGLPQVEIGAPRLGLAGQARREDDGVARRGEDEIALVAERLGRGVPVKTLGHPGRSSGRLTVAADRLDEQMVLGVVVPRIPVADEHPVIDLAGCFPLGHGLAHLDRGVQIGRVRIDGQGHSHLVARGADAIGVHVQRQIGHLHRRRRGRGHAPDLAGARLARQEVQIAVPAPAGGVGALVRDGQSARRHVRRVQVQHPQAAGAAVGLYIRRRHRIDDVAPVRRHLRISQPVGRDHILIGEGVGRRGRSRNRRGRNLGQGRSGAHQGARQGNSRAGGGQERTVAHGAFLAKLAAARRSTTVRQAKVADSSEVS